MVKYEPGWRKRRMEESVKRCEKMPQWQKDLYAGIGTDPTANNTDDQK